MSADAAAPPAFWRLAAMVEAAEVRKDDHRKSLSTGCPNAAIQE
jgi:hypothetical protein